MSLHYISSLCTGCQACQMACMDQRDIRPMEGERPLCKIRQREENGRLDFCFDHCTQCFACGTVCPMGCFSRDEHGIVRHDPAACIRCGACAEACPQGVISLGAVLKKCDGCIDRVLAGRLPACAHTCPTGALTWKENEHDL